eukprot:TRINITY_DN23563_c0_g1_i1.p1 TRINITY_DN23563_c0_g1~~TRINITY_DN23563_c0_g1_i1.p1  ORF type:complete len:218 (-),score=39.25 TRINITY_DN23563_c0_g1_i1:77-667(-)
MHSRDNDFTNVAEPVPIEGACTGANPDKGILFENRHFRLTETHLYVKWYYFPFGTKKIAYGDIKSMKWLPRPHFLRLKHWGIALSKIVWHLDSHRFSRPYYIDLDIGQWLHVGMTTDRAELSQVYGILRRKIAEAQKEKMMTQRKLNQAYTDEDNTNDGNDNEEHSRLIPAYENPIDTVQYPSLTHRRAPEQALVR